MRRMLICLGAVVLLGCVSLGVAAAGPAQVAGKWTLKYGKSTHTLELTQDGEKLTGKMIRASGTHAPIAGTIQGNTIQFAVPKEMVKMGLMPQFEGTVSGDTMKGEARVGPANFPWEATRQK